MEKRRFISISGVGEKIHVLMVTLCLFRSLLPLGWYMTVVCSVQISTTRFICIGLLDLQVTACCLDHNKSSLSQLTPSGTRYFSPLRPIYLCYIQHLPSKRFLSLTLGKSYLQRLRTCMPFPTALSKPLSLESDAICLTSLSSISRLSAVLSQHQTSQVITC